ncbi:MAG: 3-phosphoglycerate dehydrogenase [Clostridia bacterium]|nr:3-phosphoglycerate dehydrogenase [Clostridia bacterium]
MEYNIKTLNSISPAIYSELRDNYHVSDSFDSPDAIRVRSASMHDMTIPGSVQCIARAGAGTNNIPIDVCSEAGICVFNTPGANANAVCELVIAAMLLSCRNIIGGIAWEKTQIGQGDNLEMVGEKGKSQFVGPELRGKTLGVIGLGAIGVLVSNAAVALGMNVIGYDPMISVEHAWKLSRKVRHENSLDALFSESDFLTVHVPLNDKTRGMIGSRAFSLCKKGVRIMNFARGGLVDEASLITALGDERVACYVTDFGSETLLKTEGVICLPHLGASTPESEENCAVMAAAQTRDYLESGIIRNSVNLPAVDLAPLSKPRLVCIHSNIPNVLSSITTAVSGFSLNISDLVNRSRGNMAVSVLDIDDLPESDAASLIEKVSAIDGMKRVRLLTC